MKKRGWLCFFFLAGLAQAQTVSRVLIAEIPMQADRFVGVDDYTCVYYTVDEVLYKESNGETLRYTNLQLGRIGNVDILDPLEITVFYPDFNTVIKLDNTLNEIVKIDFNRPERFRNVRYATTANDKNLWIFNSDLQQLEIFNYKTGEVIPVNRPLDEEVIDQKSNYNFCRLLTRTALFTYNIYGSLLSVTPAEDYGAFSQSGAHIVLKKDKMLFYMREGSGRAMPLKIPEIHLKDFYINGNNLYIYEGKKLYQYQLNFSKKE